MKRELHKQAKTAVEKAIGPESQIINRSLRRDLRSCNPFSYRENPYWYRVWLKYRNKALDDLAEQQAKKQMRLF